MPILNWIGKEAVVNHDKEVPFRLLKKVKSLSYGENSQNLIIHGDNLEALKALMPYYQGQVKCIYIDPPYNTGNEGWVYNDKVNSPKIRKWFEQKIEVKADDLCRHDKWLCMMYPRLKLLKDLLSDDGVIFVSIDDNEYANLKQIMDDIFGEGNFIANLIWRKKRGGGRGNSLVIPQTEYVLTYTRNVNKLNPFTKELSEYKIKKFKYEDTWGKYNREGLDHHSPKGAYERKTLQYNLEIDGKQIYCPTGQWLWSKERVDKELKNYTLNKEGTKEYKYLDIIQDKNKRWRAFKKVRLEEGEEEREETILSFIDNPQITNNASAFEIKDIFGSAKFNYAKPSSLVKYLIKTGSDKEGIILDSFAGSGTTGQAVLDLNKEDGGNRKFILVELEDKVAKDITAERVKRSIEKYDYKDGFEFCELDKPLFNQEGQIEQECTFEQLATYIYFTETNTNIDRKAISGNFIGGYDETEYYLIFKEKGKNVLSKEVLKKLQKDNKRKVIYADKCLIDERTLDKRKIQFKQIPYEVKVY